MNIQRPCTTKGFETIYEEVSWPTPIEQIQLYNNHIKKQKKFAKNFEIFDNLTEIYEKDMEYGTRLITNTSLIRLNFSTIALTLPYSRVDILEYKRSESLLTLIGKIGGQLSLYAGITFIALLEIILLMIHLSEYAIKKISAWRQSRKAYDVSVGQP